MKGLRKRFARAQPPPAGEVAGELKEIEGLIAANIEETRQYVWDLREQTGTAGALGPALTQLVGRAAEATPGIAVRVQVEGTAVPLDRHVSRELLRIAQEALSNALHHAAARHIDVRLCYDHECVKLTVSDDGRGFDPGAAPGAGAGHFGLVGMRERASSIGAFAVDSQPGKGTKVEVTVTMREQPDV
jgi:signal transduction histidine kinase